MKYVAGIRHDEKTVTKLTMVQYHTYNAKTKNILMVISVAAIFGAVFLGFNSLPGIMCLMIGCLLFSSIDYPARSMAKKICEQEKDHMPWAKYEAAEDGFWVTSGNGTWKVEYADFFSIIEDSEFFYIFINRMAGYMVPKASIQNGTVEGFKNFICEKSGLDIEKPGRKWRMYRNTPIQMVMEKFKGEDPNMSEAKAARKAAEAEERASKRSRADDYKDRLAEKYKIVNKTVEEDEESEELADIDEAEEIEDSAEESSEEE